MNQHLQTILDFIQRNESLPAEEKNKVLQSIKQADKELEITNFKLDRTEKVKKTTAILLEETITELEQKRKAVESQNKELEIETALERVRTVAMSMKQPTDMLYVCRMISAQLQQLGFKQIRNVQTVIIYPQKNQYINYQYFTPYDKDTVEIIDYRLHPDVLEFTEKMLESPDAFYTKAFEGEALKTWREYRKKTNQLDDPKLDEAASSHYYFYSIGSGALGVTTYAPLGENEINLFKRFRNVFELAYKRFIDIENAQIQAREAQIQLALERVRARTMAMQKSDELLETSQVLFQQLNELGEPAEQLTIGIINEEERVFEISATFQGSKFAKTVRSSFDEPYMMKRVYNGWKANKKSLVLEIKGDELQAYNIYRNNLVGEQKFPIHIHPGERWVGHVAYFSKGILSLATNKQLPTESVELLERFASVFDLTYTRFLDLKNAEAQAREAKIEAALERVRSKAMAMHRTEDLQPAVAVVFEELEKLEIGVLRCGISVLDKEKRTGDVWVTSTTTQGPAVQVSGGEPFDIHPLLQGAFEAWLQQKDFSYLLEGDDLARYYSAVKAVNFLLPESQMITSNNEFKRQYAYVAVYQAGGLFAFRDTEFSEHAKKVMRRFANVFDLTYKRFLDLQKAEANAKEAQIEASLERVRGKAMAMYDSSDLSATASMVFTELRKLGIKPIRCGVGLLNKESHQAQLYSATSSPAGDSLALVGWVLLEGHPVLEKIYTAWLNNEDYFPELSGEQLKSYYELLLAGLSVSVPDWQTGQKQFGHFFSTAIGCLYAWSESPYNDTEIKILKRFASIIDLTFRRYLDLQKSEASAKEAVKQAALDRIRAEIASMRTVNDLNRITPLIWNELTILGIPFIRCGVFIMDEKQQLIHTFLSTPTGKAIAAFHLRYDTPGNIELVVGNWKNKTKYLDHWDEKEFYQFAEILAREGALDSAENYLKTIPTGGFYLHFLPFLQGMLYVGNSEQLNDEQIEVIQHLADAFSTAYARYEDFNRLEAAKQQVEKTLTDLKQAQQQLIQSEKMASLGELTAGIAHEIQNPLNFVNNFSEVNAELIEEMKTEIEKGNLDDAKAIAYDISENEKKINHHGKRADAIVKGMLQHSRTSSGIKEPTNINVLADEYLRLAYHGLRAKDKTFNATMKTDFDETIGDINIIPQDIGRVMLNLITNAFYAVSAKASAMTDAVSAKALASADSSSSETLVEKYEPTVTVSTKKVNNKIEVRVKDNGNGIPPKFLDKIFQPFFTTKPTGQGTGLGLSLSYDIVKAHDGEMKVDTKEGEGSVFIIQLPVN